MIPLPLRAALSLALLATLIGSPAAGSQRPRSGVVAVCAHVVQECAVGTTPLRFCTGAFPVAAVSGAEAIGTVAFDCSKGIRAMVGSGRSLNDNLYIDATRQTVWGDGSGGTEDVLVDRPRPNQDITVEPPQPVSAGRYMDVHTVTILF